MVKDNLLIGNSEKIELKNILESGRNKAMSLLNFQLDISYFNIDIKVKRDDEKRKKRIEKKIMSQAHIEQELERRRNQEYNSMLYNMIMHR